MVLLALLAASYVGNLACKPCHTKLFETYVSSPMARTSGVVDSAPAGVFNEVRIDNRGIARWAKSERKLDYFIGSGAHGRSYLFSHDRFLFQAPFTWYTQQNKWDASPGYESDRKLRWSRPIEPNCLWCHASQAKPIYGTINRYADPPFENGVTCERCHGPGSDHVAGKGPLVNPAKLDAPRRDAICAQCHLSGEARIEKVGKRLSMYRPGDLLSEYVAFFTAEGGAMKATSHYEKLQASACKQASGDKLWCGTCHSPHRAVSANAACQSCHGSTECNRGPNCATCHMPKAKVVDGGHGVLTDHSIPRRIGSGKVSAGWELKPWPGYESSRRELGLAYAEVSVRTRNDRQQKAAVELLDAENADAEVLLRRAYLNQQKGDQSGAAELYRRALRLQPHAITALVNLGAMEAGQGNYDAAISLWRRALSANPAQPEAGRNLATLLRALGRQTEAAQIEANLRAFGE
jgi:tetratricopeptide (TPR) repeat protein